MANKSRSKSAELRSAAYKSAKRWESNRKKRLERTLKAQPNNEQVKLALKGMVYRRKTPNTREWSASWIQTAKLFKEFAGRFDRDIMSSNVEVARNALQKQSPVAARTKLETASDKGFFSIMTRISAKEGSK